MVMPHAKQPCTPGMSISEDEEDEEDDEEDDEDDEEDDEAPFFFICLSTCTSSICLQFFVCECVCVRACSLSLSRILACFD